MFKRQDGLRQATVDGGFQDVVYETDVLPHKESYVPFGLTAAQRDHCLVLKHKVTLAKNEEY